MTNLMALANEHSSHGKEERGLAIFLEVGNFRGQLCNYFRDHKSWSVRMMRKGRNRSRVLAGEAPHT